MSLQTAVKDWSARPLQSAYLADNPPGASVHREPRGKHLEYLFYAHLNVFSSSGLFGAKV